MGIKYTKVYKNNLKDMRSGSSNLTKKNYISFQSMRVSLIFITFL